MIGGCCGTTPEYTARIRQAVAGRGPIKREHRIFVLPKSTSISKAPTDNPVQQVFETRERIVSVEMRANTFPQLRRLLREAKGLATTGVDLFDVTDNSGAAVNIGAVGTAYRLQQATQIPTLIHCDNPIAKSHQYAITPSGGGSTGHPRKSSPYPATIPRRVPMKQRALFPMSAVRCS